MRQLAGASGSRTASRHPAGGRKIMVKHVSEEARLCRGRLCASLIAVAGGSVHATELADLGGAASPSYG